MKIRARSLFPVINSPLSRRAGAIHNWDFSIEVMTEKIINGDTVLMFLKPEGAIKAKSLID